MAIDPYVYPSTQVLKNKLNIHDGAILEEAEFEHTHYRIQQKLPEGQFDYNHLKAIHKHVFQDLYDWAGQERIVRISKGDSLFAYPEYINSAINKQFNDLKKDKFLVGNEPALFAKKAASYFNEINAVHPFREGNGRTLRVFFDALAKQAGYQLKWEKVSRQEYLQASIAGFDGDNIAMEQVFKKIASPVHSKKMAKKTSTENVESSRHQEPIEFPLTKPAVEALKEYAKAVIEYSEQSKKAIKIITQGKSLSEVENKALDEAKAKIEKVESKPSNLRWKK